MWRWSHSAWRYRSTTSGTTCTASAPISTCRCSPCQRTCEARCGKTAETTTTTRIDVTRPLGEFLTQLTLKAQRPCNRRPPLFVMRRMTLGSW
jgi:hypothetical protein